MPRPDIEPNSQKDIMFWPGKQPITADSEKEPKITAFGADSPRVPLDYQGRMFVRGLRDLAAEDEHLAFAMYLSRFAEIRRDGSVTFEDNSLTFKFDVNKPRNRFGRYG